MGDKLSQEGHYSCSATRRIGELQWFGFLCCCFNLLGKVIIQVGHTEVKARKTNQSWVSYVANDNCRTIEVCYY
jgi:hypothetical protein